jgi:hypothetical protein
LDSNKSFFKRKCFQPVIKRRPAINPASFNNEVGKKFKSKKLKNSNLPSSPLEEESKQQESDSLIIEG